MEFVTAGDGAQRDRRATVVASGHGSDQEMEHGVYQRTRSRSNVDQSTLVYNSSRARTSSGTGLPGTWHDTIIGTEAGEVASPHSPYFQRRDLTNLDSPYASSELTDALLMAHNSTDSLMSDPAEFGMCSVGMAGIEMAARGSVIDAELQHARPSCDSVTSLRPTNSRLRSSHMLTSPRSSVGTSCEADRTF